MVDGLVPLIRTSENKTENGEIVERVFLSADKWRYSIQMYRPIDRVAIKGSLGTKTNPGFSTLGKKELQTARQKNLPLFDVKEKSRFEELFASLNEIEINLSASFCNSHQKVHQKTLTAAFSPMSLFI